MSKRTAVGSMSEWSGILADLFRQIKDGSKTRDQLQAFLEGRNPFEVVASDSTVATLLSDWAKFYREVFGIELDASRRISVPVKRDGFDRLLVMAQGMTPEWLYQKCQELFPSWKWTDDSLDEIVKSDRTVKDGAYAIWVRDRVEADEELKNLSANQLASQVVPGTTLEERLVYELKFWKESGKHLDIQSVTLCAGSRYRGGHVPRVDWCGGALKVSRCHTDRREGSLRSRQAVS